MSNSIIENKMNKSGLMQDGPEEKPIISVIMSVYNESESQLDRSIRSILNQSFTDFEFLIVNDNPENHLIDDVLKRYEDPRIRIIRNKKNIGLTLSLNKAIEASRGEYIARMDADDCSLKDRLKHQFDYMQENGLDLLGSYIYLVNEKGMIYAKKEFPVSSGIISFYLNFENVMAHPTWFVKRDVYDKVGLYRNIPYCEDYDFLLRAKKRGIRFGNIPEYLFNYTKRQNSITESSGNKHFYNSLILLDHYSDLEGFDEQHFASYVQSKDYETFLFKIGNYQNAMAELRSDPSSLFRKGVLWKMLGNKYFYLFAFKKAAKLLLDPVDELKRKKVS